MPRFRDKRPFSPTPKQRNVSLAHPSSQFSSILFSPVPISTRLIQSPSRYLIDGRLEACPRPIPLPIPRRPPGVHRSPRSPFNKGPPSRSKNIFIYHCSTRGSVWDAANESLILLLTRFLANVNFGTTCGFYGGDEVNVASQSVHAGERKLSIMKSMYNAVVTFQFISEVS